MSSRRSWRYGAGMTLLLLVAACSDDALAPADFADPLALQTELNEAEGAFQSPAFASFTAISPYLGPTPAAPVRPLLAATLHAFPRSADAAYGSAAARGELLRQLAPQLQGLQTGPVIDGSLYGRVYRWDAALDQYTWNGSETVGGISGVRFILYAVDAFGDILEPVSEVGSVDLVDNSTLTSLRLQITVRGPGGGTTYLTYQASASPSTSGVSVSVDGTVTNGLSGVDNKTLTFGMGIDVTSNGVEVEVTFALNNPAISIMLREAVELRQDGSALVEIEFRVQRASELVRVLMRVDTASPELITVDVRVNTGRVATLSGDPSSAVWVDAGGDPLGIDDLDALDHLYTAFAQFELVALMFMEPTLMLSP